MELLSKTCHTNDRFYSLIYNAGIRKDYEENDSVDK